MRSEYYTIITVSLTSLIPVISGIIAAYFYNDNNKSPSHIFGISYKGVRITADLLRKINLFLVCFLSLLLFIRLANPLPSEGWLRTIIIMVLFSAESLVIYYLIRLSSSGMIRIVIIAIVILLFAALPSGLLLHKPWTYLLFVSPFYWLGWTWVIPPAVESGAYAAIAAVLTTFYTIGATLFFRTKKID